MRETWCGVTLVDMASMVTLVTIISTIFTPSLAYQVVPGQNLYDSGPGNFPNDTHITIVVAVDNNFLDSHGVGDKAALETLITNNILAGRDVTWYLTYEDFQYVEMPDASENFTMDYIDIGKIIMVTSICIHIAMCTN